MPTLDSADWLCECQSFNCVELVTLTAEQASRIANSNPRLYLVVDHCLKGPEESDQLVEKHKGYSLYKENE